MCVILRNVPIFDSSSESSVAYISGLGGGGGHPRHNVAVKCDDFPPFLWTLSRGAVHAPVAVECGAFFSPFLRTLSRCTDCTPTPPPFLYASV